MMNVSPWLVRRLAIGLSASLVLAACSDPDAPPGQADTEDVGDDAPPVINDGGDPDGGGTNGGGEDSLADFEWAQTSLNIEIAPPAESENGNDALAPDSLAYTLRAEVTARRNEDAEQEVPITTARVGMGDTDAADDADFTWVDLTHQGEGIYTAEVTGLAVNYRARFEGPIFGTRVHDLEDVTPHIITSPTQGRSYSDSSDLSVSYEPIEINYFAILSLNGTELTRTSRREEKMALAVPASELSPGSHQVELTRMKFRGTVGGDTGGGGIILTLTRTVSVEIQ
ncbi:hypothetical protein DL240_11245 [Lujinxingia litoralis]|uniref:Uncharacterized protein n=1 Tax=Lujinxingia litoralis TaxID=2211119 RepID=A0A328C914_9DELT|nr:hypothetical protein [Lujinxingia litoralis]RAL22415.1 hypothetical protein DL240_11245 [Lujinxingia litoralis]